MCQPEKDTGRETMGLFMTVEHGTNGIFTYMTLVDFYGNLLCKGENSKPYPIGSMYGIFTYMWLILW